ncbi:MAG TPA: HEAT repeat domain-containing protein [Gemmatimonadales bacterium]
MSPRPPLEAPMRILTITLLLGAIAAPAAAQSLAERVSRAPDGTIRMSFAARDGVRGCGDNITVNDDRDADWESDCKAGPVFVSFQRRDGRVSKLKARVGGQWRDGAAGTDLGTVSAPEAAGYLLALAERDAGARDAIFAATIADSVTIWPSLLGIARNERAAEETRKTAIFWLGQAAGQAIAPALDSIASSPGEREVKETAVFALSQRPADESVPALIRIARTNRDPHIRRSALFWLGQSKDPRALDLFEELLTGT